MLLFFTYVAVGAFHNCIAHMHTMVGKSFSTPRAFVTNCISLKISLKSASAVYFCAVTNIRCFEKKMQLASSLKYADTV